MKKICKAICISLLGYHSILTADTNIEQILKKIEAFKKTKETSAKIVLRYDPFFPKRAKEKKKSKKQLFKKPVAKKSYRLKAILNKKAFINKKWYETGDIIGSYKIDKIGNEKVLLVRGKKSIILDLSSSKRVLKIKDNRI